MKPNDDLPGGLEALSEIDKLVHEPARLSILAHLYVLERADFLFLMNQTGLTSGNLSAHMTKLEQAGYLKVDKEFVDKRPLTVLQLTEKGRAAFRRYREQMQSALDGLPD